MGAMSGRGQKGRKGEKGSVLLVDSLVQRVKIAIQLEETVELSHEVARYCPGCWGQQWRELR